MCFCPDYVSSTVVGGIGHGMIYLSGMTYIQLRSSNSQHRVARVALCHLSMAIGMVSSSSYMSFLFHWQSDAYYVYGYFLVYSAGSVLVLFLFNELLNGLGVISYKQCLDQQLKQADERRDRLRSALAPYGANKKTCKPILLTLIAIVSKLASGFMFNNIFLVLTIAAQSEFLSPRQPMLIAILHYCSMGGIIVGIIVSLSMRVRLQFPLVLIGKSVFLIIAAVCYTARIYRFSAIFFWVFYVVGSAGLFLSDVAIMEVARPQLMELSLFLGFFVGQIPIIVSIYFAREELSHVLYWGDVLWVNVSVCVAVAIALAILVGALYPNTHRLKVLEVQRLILYNNATLAVVNNNVATAPRPSYHHPVSQVVPTIAYSTGQPQQMGYNGGNPHPGLMYAPQMAPYPGQQPHQSMFMAAAYPNYGQGSSQALYPTLLSASPANGAAAAAAAVPGSSSNEKDAEAAFESRQQPMGLNNVYGNNNNNQSTGELPPAYESL